MVGEPITVRRRDLGLRSMRKAALSAGLSESVWRQIETGRRQVQAGEWVAPSPSAETKAAVCKRLLWLPDGIDRLLAGDPPTAIEALTADELLATTRRDPADVADYNSRLARMPDHVRRAVEAIIDAEERQMGEP